MNKKQVFYPSNKRIYVPTFGTQMFRPGSLDMLRHPSRMGNTLHYPDGRIVKDPR